MSDYNQLISCLYKLLGALEIERDSALYQGTITVSNYLGNLTYRIAVFAPFNHGKSTLLNALLGSKTLPIDLIPTTGAAICIKYGEELYTVISLKDGTEIKQSGIKILNQYAILDSNRRMKDEVKAITVFCNHAWLETGIELLDLPGTNDREAQNDLVKDQLLSADLIIQVLDARKLMTLEEREHLQQWLNQRGITNVIFVINFLNLLTPEEQQEVKQRIYFISESFRSSLPAGISNIYCVDALPALRARLKGNYADTQTTGITSLESALQNIVNLEKARKNKLSRVIKIAEQLAHQASLKRQEIEAAITIKQAKINRQLEINQKAEKLIQQSFNRSLADFQGWLYLPPLLTSYQPSLAIALQETRFAEWLTSKFQPDVLKHQQTINKWIKQGCDFFNHDHPSLLKIDFPDPPVVEIAAANSHEPEDNHTDKSYIPQELNFLLQKKAGAVVLGGANYLINKLANKSLADNSNQINNTTRISAQVYVDAAEKYLHQFSQLANQSIHEYEQIAYQYITYHSPEIKPININTEPQIQLLNNLLTELNLELEKLS